MDFKQKQALQILESSYDMYEKTKRETVRRMSDELNEDGSKKWSEEYINEKVQEIQYAQDDIVEQYIQTGGNPDDLKKKKNVEKKTLSSVKPFKTQSTTPKKTTVKKVEKEEKKEMTKTTSKVNKNTYIPKKREYNSNVAYDVIPLPSKGEVYKHKTDRVQVSYLTAHDENMFVSPNLYRDGLLIDFLLQLFLLKMV